MNVKAGDEPAVFCASPGFSADTPSAGGESFGGMEYCRDSIAMKYACLRREITS